MYGEIITAALEPFTHTESFFGLLAALAFRRQVRDLVNWSVGRAKGKLGSDAS